ncbi:MAG: M48 family metallopeptidase [Anaerolineales bacterium]|nr:M48 family metallopeptidase [Anaerolineales bacterium]
MKKFRHPKEKTAALVTFGLGLLASLFFVTVTFGCGLFLLGLGFAWISITMLNNPRLDQYHRINHNNLPELYEMVHQIRKQWRMADLDIYLNPTRQINASASDFGKDFLIVNQGLWMSIQNDVHRKFVIGHELGHIGLGHSWLRVLAYQADNAFQGSLLGILFQFLLLNYSRKKELSADRIGLLSCGDLTAALEVLAFLELSPHNPNMADIRQAVKQMVYGKADHDFSLGELLSTHPDMHERAKELIAFARQIKMI